MAAAAAACAQRSDDVRRASRARVLRAARAPRAEQFRALEHPAHRFTLPCRRRKPPERARPRAGRRAVSKRGVRRERRGRMISGLCELPAHTLLAAAPRSQPPARARPRGAGLTLRGRIWPSRGADYSPRISLQAAAFCARSLASASKLSKMVPNLHQTRLQHPSSCLNSRLQHNDASPI